MEDYPNNSSASTPRPFGPFLDIPADNIKLAGFQCSGCQQPVEQLFKVVPDTVVRLNFYACECGTAVCWEDEAQPESARTWGMVVALMKETRTKVAIFNGNRPLSPDFSGVN